MTGTVAIVAAFQATSAASASPLHVSTFQKHLDLVSCFAAKSHFPRQHEVSDSSASSNTNIRGASSMRFRNLVQDYIMLVRPMTLVQAVGAFVVGCLSIVGTAAPPSAVHNASNISVSSMLSIYLLYAAGMVINDVVDSQSGVDAMHVTKKNRPIASGRISVPQGWTYCTVLSATSCLLAAVNNAKFFLWSCSNLAVMLSYALGLQNVLFLKNAIVGYLSISPLIGVILVGGVAGDGGVTLSKAAISRLQSLASVGMAVSEAREVLKDIEDTRVDRKAGKATIPNVYSPKVAHRVAFGIVWVTCIVMVLPHFRNMFGRGQSMWCYLSSWVVGTSMIARAAFLPVQQGQRLLKKSIYVLLGGMVAGFMTAST